MHPLSPYIGLHPYTSIHTPTFYQKEVSFSSSFFDYRTKYDTRHIIIHAIWQIELVPTTPTNTHIHFYVSSFLCFDDIKQYNTRCILITYSMTPKRNDLSNNNWHITINMPIVVCMFVVFQISYYFLTFIYFLILSYKYVIYASYYAQSSTK